MHQRAGLRGNACGPVGKIGFGRNVDDHRMAGGAALGGIDTGYRVRVLGIGAKAIDRLGRKRHQPALLEHLDRMRKIRHGQALTGRRRMRTTSLAAARASSRV